MSLRSIRATLSPRFNELIALAQTMRCLIVAALIITAGLSTAAARVERLEIVSRQAFAAGAEFGSVGAYEKLRGRAVFVLDPNAVANAPIADLKLAPRNDRGLVEFSAEFLVLRPVDAARGNGMLLYEVNNRGNIAMLRQLNDAAFSNDPETPAEAGNGFLLRRGFTLLWSAWAADVAGTAGDDRLILRAPVATENGAPITGKVAYDLIVNAPTAIARFTGMLGTAYPPASEDAPDALLTERDRPDGERREIPRAAWSFVPPMSGAVATEIGSRAASSPGGSISSPTRRAIRSSSRSEWRVSAISCPICAIIRWRASRRRRSA